jgi:hypothetical protein
MVPECSVGGFQRRLGFPDAGLEAQAFVGGEVGVVFKEGGAGDEAFQGAEQGRSSSRLVLGSRSTHRSQMSMIIVMSSNAKANRHSNP